MNTLKKMLSTAITLAAVVTAGHANAATPSTQEVWDHHIQAWKSRSVAQILEDYSDDSDIIVNNRVYRGKLEIAALFQTLFTVFDLADEHVIDPATVIGDIVYITWRAKINGHNYPFGTDTFVIRDGKIAYQTIASDSRLFQEGDRK